MLNKFSLKKWWEKGKETVLLVGLAIALVVVGWNVFHREEAAQESVLLSETEKKLTAILSNIDGVGAVEVMICETEEGVKSVVVVCEGGNNFQVIMSVRQAVAAALGTSEKSVKVSQKK